MYTAKSETSVCCLVQTNNVYRELFLLSVTIYSPSTPASVLILVLSLPASKFTQADIDHLKIAYIPPQTDIGPESRLVRMAFTVEDASGNKLYGQTFDIEVSQLTSRLHLTCRKGIHADSDSKMTYVIQ